MLRSRLLPQVGKKQVEVLFRWTHSQFYRVMQTTCHRFPNCHGNTSRMYVKWLWIYLSHVIASLEDQDGCVYGNSKKTKKTARTEKKFIVAPSNRSQDSSNTASAGIAAPRIGSTGESGEWAPVLRWVTNSSARATGMSTGATRYPGNHINNSPRQDGAEVQLVARTQ